MDIDETIRLMARDAKQAAGVIGRCATAQKNQALTNMADLLEQQAETIFQENRKDLKRAGDAGLSDAMVDRLTVTQKTIAAMAAGLRETASGLFYARELFSSVVPVCSFRHPTSGILGESIR